MTTGPKFPANTKRGYRNLERAAAAARQKLGIASTARIDALDVLSGLRRLRPRVGGRTYPLDYHAGHLEPGVLAKTHFVAEHPHDPHREPTIEIMLSNETMVRLEQGEPRALFSLGHELGHGLLHAPEVVRLSAIPHETAALLRGNYTEIPFYQDVEWQANGFAAAFLMPAQMLLQLESCGRLTVSELCQRMGVSMKSATIRIDVFRQRKFELI